MSLLSFRNDPRISPDDRSLLREFCTELGGEIVTLARSLGLKVFETPMEAENSGYIAYDPTCGSTSDYKIVLNANDTVERRRFTLAHEIGHYVLHRNSPEFRSRRDRSAQIFEFPSGHRSADHWDYEDFPLLMEREANAFAANVLLPAPVVRQTAEFINGEPVALAKKLGLSVSFVVRRFEEIKFE